METPDAGDAPGALPTNHAAGQPPGSDAAGTIQTKARYDGSYSLDDDDRPRWDRETEIVAEYDYRREDGSYSVTKIKGRRRDGEKVFLTARRFQGGMGNLQFEKRENPEDFYRLRGLESYLKGAGGEPDLLYRLDELVRSMADRPEDQIFITEGEKDTDTLRQLGLIATTNPNGASNWKTEFNARFAGRDCVIMVDNDDKGRQRCASILAALSGVAASVKPVELPGLSVNGDVSDWLDSGKTLDDLLQAVAAAEVAEPLAGFDTDDRGNPYPSIENARLAVALLGAEVRYDEFAARYIVTGLSGFGPVLDDAGLTRMRLLVEERWRLKFGKERWGDIVTDHARTNSVHPVREYLDALCWDGVGRIDRWLNAYAGAENTDYVRAVSAICLIAAVRRVRRPGCKFDEMLVLEGEQGGNKSSALGLLAVNDDWFSDDLPLDSDSKVLMERTAGRWLVELAELKGLRRGAVEHVKSMLSRRVDKARLAYGRMTTEQPRQCVFFGTTNDGKYLRDMTGNRRFWPVEVNRFDLALLRRDRDQLWAEAAAREADGESIRLPEKLWAAAGEQQEGREIGDPFYEILSERLEGWEGKIRGCDVWGAVGLGDGSRPPSQDENMRLNAAMQKLGWRRPKSKLRFDGRPQNAWVKGDKGALVDAYFEVPRNVVLGLDESGQSRRPF